MIDKIENEKRRFSSHCGSNKKSHYWTYCITGNDTIKYAGGRTRAFYQIGLSANKTGISVYILGIKDKTFSPNVWKKARQGDCNGVLY